MSTRKTVDVADDLILELRHLQKDRNVRFKDIVNELLRIGLRDLELQAQQGSSD